MPPVSASVAESVRALALVLVSALHQVSLSVGMNSGIGKDAGISMSVVLQLVYTGVCIRRSPNMGFVSMLSLAGVGMSNYTNCDNVVSVSAGVCVDFCMLRARIRQFCHEASNCHATIVYFSISTHSESARKPRCSHRDTGYRAGALCGRVGSRLRRPGGGARVEPPRWRDYTTRMPAFVRHVCSRGTFDAYYLL